MAPELVQVCVFTCLSLTFLVLALWFLWKKHWRLKAVITNNPCVTYIRGRFETAKLFDKVVTSSNSRFTLIQTHISDLIKMKLECGYLASEEHKSLMEKKHKLLDIEIWSIMEDLEVSLAESQVTMEKLQTAMMYEANERLVEHPLDLIGLRRLKLFEDSLKRYQEEEKQPLYILKTLNNIFSIIKKKVSLLFSIKAEGFQNNLITSLKIIFQIIVVTLLVNGNDYAQDFNFLKTFWSIGTNGFELDIKNSDKLSAIILLKFYPPAMFLTVVVLFSSVLVVIQLRSLWFKYKVDTLMECPRTEIKSKQIDPRHVINQYNLTLTEASKESVWQLMVQWGCYFCFAWFITWRLRLSEEHASELEKAGETLSFSTLYLCLISSVVSLSFAQFRAHSIFFKFRTSTKQKAIYLFSSVMSTLCNVLILISWQTAIVDFGIGNDIYEENSFGFFDLEILIIAFLLVTPFFYAHMVLPTSQNNFITTSINCPSFFSKMSIQCLVVSFYLGLTAFINSYVYAWGPKLQPSLGEIAANITGNRDFEKMYITPSTAYEGSPMNNRLVLIIVSCIGIPCTWIGAYLGLYAYFSEMTCNIVFYPSTRIQKNLDPLTEERKRRSAWDCAGTFIKKVQSSLLWTPETQGKWQDLNYVDNVRDRENERKFNNFVTKSVEERSILARIKVSFPCWQNKKRKTFQNRKNKSRLFFNFVKFAASGLCLYFVTIIVGPLCGEAKNIALYFME